MISNKSASPSSLCLPCTKAAESRRRALTRPRWREVGHSLGGELEGSAQNPSEGGADQGIWVVRRVSGLATAMRRLNGMK